MKSSIYKSTGKKKLEYFQFIALLFHIQNANNSCPLTYRDSDVNNLLNKLKDISDSFKTLLYDSYLIYLRETSRDIYEDGWTDRVQVGNIVLISTPNKNRVSWAIGRVSQLLTCADDKTRGVKVKRGDSTDACSINHLYPLELSLLTEKQVESREQP